MAAASRFRCALIGAAALLAGCQGESQQTQAAIAAAADTPNAMASSPEQPAAEPGDGDRPAMVSPVGEPAPAPGDFAIRPDRDLEDMVAGCAHQYPERRPRGSNCYGIFPEQCGADRAAVHVGQPLTAGRRRQIEAITPPGGIRFIRPGEPVTDDLRFQRLNVALDAQGRVEKVDCY